MSHFPVHCGHNISNSWVESHSYQKGGYTVPPARACLRPRDNRVRCNKGENQAHWSAYLSPNESVSVTLRAKYLQFPVEKQLIPEGQLYEHVQGSKAMVDFVIKVEIANNEVISAYPFPNEPVTGILRVKYLQFLRESHYYPKRCYTVPPIRACRPRANGVHCSKGRNRKHWSAYLLSYDPVTGTLS